MARGAATLSVQYYDFDLRVIEIQLLYPIEFPHNNLSLTKAYYRPEPDNKKAKNLIDIFAFIKLYNVNTRRHKHQVHIIAQIIYNFCF